MNAPQSNINRSNPITMNREQEPVNQAQKIIRGYISKNSHLFTMERIHQNFVGENRTFSRWSEVIDVYSNMSWSDEKIRNFAQITKKIVEDNSEESESYFKIVEPKNIDVEYLTEELERNQFDPEADLGERDGFRYEVTGGIVTGDYIYTDISVELSQIGVVDEYVSEGAIHFRIDLENSLLISESLSVVDVQKLKSYFGKHTNMDLRVYADQTVLPDSSYERYRSFIDSIEQNGDESEIKLRAIKKMDMHNPSTGLNELTDMSLEGHEISNNTEVNELLDEDG